MNEAQPWYQSKTILALMAGIILAIAGKLGILPAELTQDQLVAFLLYFIPMVVAVITRVTSTKQVVATKAKANDINGVSSQ